MQRTQYNDTQHIYISITIKETRHSALRHSIQSVHMLSVIYAQCREKALYAECHQAVGHYAECHGAQLTT